MGCRRGAWLFYVGEEVAGPMLFERVFFLSYLLAGGGGSNAI
jgi:hypothetical protein